MTPKSSQNIFPKEDFKAVFTEASSLSRPCPEMPHMPSSNELLPRPIWFKGSRDRCLRGDIAA